MIVRTAAAVWFAGIGAAAVFLATAGLATRTAAQGATPDYAALMAAPIAAMPTGRPTSGVIRCRS